MATVTLKKPLNRLFVNNITFEQGVVHTMTREEAKAYRKNPRFDVDLNDDDEDEDEAPINPRDMSPAQRTELIRAAINELDGDVEENWTADGRADARALTKVLGWQVTSEMRDTAMGVRSAAATKKTIKFISKTKAGKLLDTGDDGTEEAIEV